MKEKTAIILSYTPITDEPRVLRQINALKKDGWDIVLCGFEGRSAKPEGTYLITFKDGADPRPEKKDNDNVVHLNSEKPEEQSGHYDPIKKEFNSFIPFLKKCIRAVTPSLLLTWILRVGHIYPVLKARFSNKAALSYYWNSYRYTEKYEYILSELKEVPNLDKSRVLVIAHDYFTMPAAKKIADHFNAKFVSDIHEYAKGQYMDSFIWKTMLRPWVDRMQKIYLPQSAYNTTVCDGIADLLAIDYKPLPRPDVIRSTPFHVEVPFKKTGEQINVLYLGNIFHARGMELAIDSLMLWKPEFHLSFRGPGDEEYNQYLLNYAKERGVSDRFSIEPPVLFNQIVPEANKSDIGYFVHKDISPQKRFTLPNKFFEYIMAGMALCVSDLPEMARISNHYDLGKLVKDFTPESVAEQINSFTREDIDRHKQNSLKAAKDLCWENESPPMVKAYNAALQDPVYKQMDENEPVLSHIGSAA